MANSENLNPAILHKIRKELIELSSNPLEGIHFLTLNEKDITDIRVSIDGPDGTPYANGQFELKILLGKSFPAEPPRGYFLTKVFHPNVAANGEICVNVLKRDWKPDLGLKHVLLTIKCLLINPNPESALNEEAGRLLLDDYDLFSKRAKLFTEIHAKKHKQDIITPGDASTSSSSRDHRGPRDPHSSSTSHTTTLGPSGRPKVPSDGPTSTKRAATDASSVLSARNKNSQMSSNAAKAKLSKRNLKRL